MYYVRRGDLTIDVLRVRACLRACFFVVVVAVLRKSTKKRSSSLVFFRFVSFRVVLILILKLFLILFCSLFCFAFGFLDTAFNFFFCRSWCFFLFLVILDSLSHVS